MVTYRGYIFRHETFSYARSVTVPGDTYYPPRMIVLGLASATLSNLVVVLVAKRETGALKQRRATPVRPAVLIGGDVITAEASALTMIVLGVHAISGTYVPESLFPAWLRDIAQVLPVRPLAVAMQAAFDPRTNGGRTFAWPDLAIVAAWGLASALSAARRFSWTPSGS